MHVWDVHHVHMSTQWSHVRPGGSCIFTLYTSRLSTEMLPLCGVTYAQNSVEPDSLQAFESVCVYRAWECFPRELIVGIAVGGARTS